MTFEEATPYIRKICMVWARRYPRQFEVDELFNEVWLGLEGDCSQFGTEYALMGCAATRRIITYAIRKCGKPGSAKWKGEGHTASLPQWLNELAVEWDGFDLVDNKDELELLMVGVMPADREILEMRYLEGLTLQEIAEKLALNGKGAVSMRLKAALGRVRKQIKQVA